jgi:Icc-related predicted phosphoesterase
MGKLKLLHFFIIMKKRITHISDTHNKHNQLNNKLIGGDLLIHSGDFSSLGRRKEVESFIKWYNAIDNYTNKVFIAGNHDLSFDSEKLMQTKIDYFNGNRFVSKTEENPYITSNSKPDWLVSLLKNELNSNVFYLENDSVTIDSIKIWGSPITPTFSFGWAFNKNRGYDINEVWNLIPDDTDIVITHGPIHSYCDRTQYEGLNVGCEQLYHRLNEIKPQLHFAGHIHECRGYRQTDWGHTFNGCICNLSYEPINSAITFDYDFEEKKILSFFQKT